MHCFVHTERDAVGVCKACAKGLCPECANDLGHGLACRGSHEQAVDRINQLTLRASQVQSTVGRAKYVSPVFTGTLGLIFCGYGYTHEGLKGFLLPMGCLFVIYSIIVFNANRRAYGNKPPST